MRNGETSGSLSASAWKALAVRAAAMLLSAALFTFAAVLAVSWAFDNSEAGAQWRGWDEFFQVEILAAFIVVLMLPWFAWQSRSGEWAQQGKPAPLLNRILPPAVLIALLAPPMTLALGILATDAHRYSYRSVGFAQIFLRCMLPGPDAAWTDVLERAVAGGDAAVVKLVVEKGSRDGYFQLVAYDAPNAPCPRSLGDGAGDALAAYLKSVEDRFFISDADDYKRFSAMLDDREAAAKCLLKGGYRYYFNLPPKSGEGIGPGPGLVDAVRARDRTLVERLVKRGANLEETNWLGQTPVMLALDGGMLSDARRLLEMGANWRALDKAGRSVAFYAARAGATDIALRPGGGASQLEGKTIADETLLHAALAGGDLKLSRELIKAGAPAQARTADGRTLMHYARGQMAVLMLLDLGLDANARDIAGRTPLHALVMDSVETARRNGAMPGPESIEYETARALVAAGADRTAVDSGGLTPAAWYSARPPAGGKPPATDPWASLLQPGVERK